MMLAAPVAVLGLALSSTAAPVRALLGPLAASLALASLASAPLQAAAASVVAERVRAGDAAAVGPATALAISLSALLGLVAGLAVCLRVGLPPATSLLGGGVAALFGGTLTAASAVGAGGYPRPLLLAAWAGPAVGAGLLLPAARLFGPSGALLAVESGLILSLSALAGDLLARSRHAVVAAAPAALRQILQRPGEALAAFVCCLGWWALLLRPGAGGGLASAEAGLLVPALTGALAALALHLTEEAAVRDGYLHAFRRVESDGALDELRRDLLAAERRARRAAMRGVALAASAALAVLALGGALGHPLREAATPAATATAAALLAAAAPVVQALGHLRRPLLVIAWSVPLPAAWLLAFYAPALRAEPLVWPAAAALQLAGLLAALRTTRQHAAADLVAGDLDIRDLLPAPAPKPPPLS